MTERTLREKIQALIDRQYSIDPGDLQALLDAHTASDAAATKVACNHPSYARVCADEWRCLTCNSFLSAEPAATYEPPTSPPH